MAKPLIGVLPLLDDEKESYWMVPGYMEGLIGAGALPVMLPPTADKPLVRQLADTCDGFLFTGGHDVSPELYGEERLPACAATSPLRDEMEKMVFDLAYEADKPIFGICRGIQFINVMMGGTLWQDLPSQRPSYVEHHQSPPYDVPAHSVTLDSAGPLYGLFSDLMDNDGKLRVNSYHHQAVKDLGSGLGVSAVSEDGLIEGVYDGGRSFLWAVQWHPEFSFKVDEGSRRLFQRFADSAAGRMK